MPSTIRKPPALRPGDTIGVVAPAAAIDSAHLARGAAALEELGYRVKISAHALDRDGILAGDDRTRAAELTAFFADPEVRAIFAARGGYGSGRLLPLLDFAKIAQTPKIFLGFSDETFLLNALVDHAGFVAFHGPMVAMDFARGVPPDSLSHLFRLLSDTAPIELPGSGVLRQGRADGILIGGCLSVIVAMLATPFAPDFTGRILFLEDTGEKAYRVDRMLNQLHQVGVFDRIAGLVFGAIRPVGGDPRERDLIDRFVGDHTARLSCPVLCGLEAGHGTANFTLPIGLHVRLDGARLIISEPAVDSSP